MRSPVAVSVARSVNVSEGHGAGSAWGPRGHTPAARRMEPRGALGEGRHVCRGSVGRGVGRGVGGRDRGGCAAAEGEGREQRGEAKEG